MQWLVRREGSFARSNRAGVAFIYGKLPATVKCDERIRRRFARADRGISEVSARNSVKEVRGKKRERKRDEEVALYPRPNATRRRDRRMQLLFSLIAGHDRLARLASRREAKVVSCMSGEGGGGEYRFSKSSTVGRSIIGFR